MKFILPILIFLLALANGFAAVAGPKMQWTDAASGHVVRRLTNLPETKCGTLYFHQEVFTADGQSMIFVGEQAGQRRIYLMDWATGRTHQLRVHCAEALGTPILGDGKYGGAAAHMEGLDGKLHLHARSLVLPHPVSGTLEIAAPLPAHMKATFKFFGFEEPRTPKPRKLA